MNELELLLVAHPGEFNLVSNGRSPFLIIFARDLGHGYGGQAVVLGEGRRGHCELFSRATINSEA